MQNIDDNLYNIPFSKAQKILKESMGSPFQENVVQLKDRYLIFAIQENKKVAEMVVFKNNFSSFNPTYRLNRYKDNKLIESKNFHNNYTSILYFRPNGIPYAEKVINPVYQYDFLYDENGYETDITLTVLSTKKSRKLYHPNGPHKRDLTAREFMGICSNITYQKQEKPRSLSLPTIMHLHKRTTVKN